jgi:hypothetical protein
MIVNYTSKLHLMMMLLARVVIYDRHMFIVQATGGVLTRLFFVVIENAAD